MRTIWLCTENGLQLGCKAPREEAPARVQVGEDHGLDQSGSATGGEMGRFWMYFKAEPTGLADGWDMGVERESSGSQLPGVWPEALTG